MQRTREARDRRAVSSRGGSTERRPELDSLAHRSPLSMAATQGGAAVPEERLLRADGGSDGRKPSAAPVQASRKPAHSATSDASATMASMVPLSPGSSELGGLRGESTLTLHDDAHMSASIPDWTHSGSGRGGADDSTFGTSPMRVPHGSGFARDVDEVEDAEKPKKKKKKTKKKKAKKKPVASADDALHDTTMTTTPKKKKKKKQAKVDEYGLHSDSITGSMLTASTGELPAMYGKKPRGVTSSVPSLPLGGTAPPGLGRGRHTASMELPNRSASAASKRPRSTSRSVTPSRGVAGYVPPLSVDTVQGETMELAKSLIADTASLKERLADPVFLLAAKQVGVDVDELLPRKLESFRQTMGTPRSSLKQRKQFFNENRTLNLAIALSNQEEVTRQTREHEERQRRMRESAAKDLLSRVEMERARMERAIAARERQRAVVDRENERLMAARDELARRIEREEMIQERRKQRAKIAHQERAVKAQQVVKAMAEVRRRREEREAERLDNIRRAEEEKMARRDMLAHRHAEERRKRLLRAEAKDRILEERREAAMSNLIRRRERMREDLEKHEVILKEKEERRLEEIQKLRDERWVAEARARANSERLRRQQAFRREAKAKMTMLGVEKQAMFEEVAAAIDKERRMIAKERQIDEDAWKEATPLERNVLPGPGEYEFRRSAADTLSTGKWRDPPVPEMRRLMETKSWVDQTPGPSQYGIPKDDLVRQAPAGAIKFHDANPKTFLDWAEYKGKQLPAPSDYGRPRNINQDTGDKAVAFSKHNPMGFLDHAAYLARDSPGPGGSVLSTKTPISPEAVAEANRPATTGSAPGMRRSLSFTATPISRGRSRSPVDGSASPTRTTSSRPSTTSGALQRPPSMIELRTASGRTLVRQKSSSEMHRELEQAAVMKGLGAPSKYLPSLTTISKQLETLVGEVSEIPEEEEEDDEDVELLEAAERDMIASSHPRGSDVKIPSPVQ
jgi:hypothetical protein